LRIKVLNTPIIQVRNVGLAYGRRTLPFKRRQPSAWALHDVSFEVHAGETIGIIGRNGAGKSTLLRILAGIIAPDRGCVVRAPMRASLLSLQVGFLAHLSGRENAILSGLLLGQSKQAILASLSQIFEFAELTEVAEQPLGTYSSGMRARLGFSVSYHCAPEILLIDEVLGVGDIGFRAKSTEAIKTIIRSNRTVVLVSHSAHTIQELCDRVVWIENGMTHAVGAPRSLIPQYEAHVKQIEHEGRSRLNRKLHGS
jgi:lipopolysaccharide transport system ATP-binding protein